MRTLSVNYSRRLSPEQVFMLSGIMVNAGNYLYNLILGRVLGPEQFADAAILITLLLVLSFVAMTFQLAVTKFSVEFENDTLGRFTRWAYKKATAIGLILGILIIVFASELQLLFQTDSRTMFVFFGCAVPLYFIMSVNRGRLQGSDQFVALSGTYQTEMIGRFVFTFLLLFLFQFPSAVGVSLGIGISFIVGIFPFKKVAKAPRAQAVFTREQKVQIRRFFILTACYECTQIICNNSDILLVKHYFEGSEAGLYSALALIGRVVYFVTWMFVMLLLPKVIALRKQGKDTSSIVLKYAGYISAIAISIVLICFLFPELAIHILFGEAYLKGASLLGWYALSTSLFALSNLFVYYFLSLDKYVPILISAILGCTQIVLVMQFHSSLHQVILMQIIAMSLLLSAQLLYFLNHRRLGKKNL
jgi:O-antigen/teichoic acid export membrane protein